MSSLLGFEIEVTRWALTIVFGIAVGTRETVDKHIACF
jgi:hypothetical protein